MTVIIYYRTNNGIFMATDGKSVNEENKPLSDSKVKIIKYNDKMYLAISGCFSLVNENLPRIH